MSKFVVIHDIIYSRYTCSFCFFIFYQPCMVTMVFVGSLLILQQWEYYWQCGIFMLQVPSLFQTPSIKCLFRLIAPWFCHIESLLSYYYFRSFSECFYIFSLLLNFVPFHQGVNIPLHGITTKFWVFLKLPVGKKSRRLFMWYIYFLASGIYILAIIYHGKGFLSDSFSFLFFTLLFL